MSKSTKIHLKNFQSHSKHTTWTHMRLFPRSGWSPPFSGSGSAHCEHPHNWNTLAPAVPKFLLLESSEFHIILWITSRKKMELLSGLDHKPQTAPNLSSHKIMPLSTPKTCEGLKLQEQNSLKKLETELLLLMSQAAGALRPLGPRLSRTRTQSPKTHAVGQRVLLIPLILALLL